VGELLAVIHARVPVGDSTQTARFGEIQILSGLVRISGRLSSERRGGPDRCCRAQA
jgi:hypothetical protein